MGAVAGRYRNRGALLASILEERIVIVDGAMATRIQTFGLDESDYRGARFRNHDRPLMGSHEVLSITRPDLIRSIHREYVEAGADILTTNTFRANALTLSSYGLADEVYAINLAAAQLASNVRYEMEETAPDWPRFVAGAVSTPDAAPETYIDQIRGLVDGGIDILLLETVFDTPNAIGALYAFEKYFPNPGTRIPVVVSATITEDGRLPSGETLEEFWNVLSPRELWGVGINCALGPSQMGPYLEQLADIATVFLVCCPNAGLPGPSAHYRVSPGDMASMMAGFAARGWLNAAGGCCGTGPDHIRRIREALHPQVPGQRPRRVR